MPHSFKRPLRIGVSSCIFHEDATRAIFKGKSLIYAEESMIRWLQAHNALPIVLPRMDGSSSQLEQFVDLVDGLVLQGGVDVSPLSYGEKPLDPMWLGDEARDQYEISLIKAFFAQKKPILGICRGHQVLNVAFGGTLFQDINTQVPNSLVHRDWEIYDQNSHKIDLTSGGYLHGLLNGQISHTVNSVHHQAIKDVAPNFIVEAKSSDDGIVEAIKHQGLGQYAVGIQWHPEFQNDRGSGQLDRTVLLEDFLKHCLTSNEVVFR